MIAFEFYIVCKQFGCDFGCKLSVRAEGLVGHCSLWLWGGQGLLKLLPPPVPVHQLCAYSNFPPNIFCWTNHESIAKSENHCLLLALPKHTSGGLHRMKYSVCLAGKFSRESSGLGNGGFLKVKPFFLLCRACVYMLDYRRGSILTASSVIRLQACFSGMSGL